MDLSLVAPNSVSPRRTMRILAGGQVAFFLLVWALAPSKILPSPLETLSALESLLSQGLVGELLVSIKLNLVSILIGSGFSLLLSYSTRIPFMRPIIAVFSDLRYLSLAGIALGFTIALGGTYWLKVSVLAFSISVFFVRSMVDVINHIPAEQYDLARTLRYSEWGVIREVVVLGTAADAFDIIRQNAAMSWMMLPFAESLVWSQGGIGVMLMDSSKHFRLESILAIQITIILCGLLQDYALGAVRHFLCPAADLRSAV